MDLVRAETRTDLAATTFGATGQGTIVAIIDRGIDWKNNDFRNDDGTTRIKYIFDMTDNTGANAPGNTYGVGTIYTEAQINSALTGGPQLATRDAVGHGTTTTAIAAGNGRNMPDRRYKGIAPNASIISVKFTSEGAPAHGTQPAEAPFYNATLFPKALDFVRDKGAELGMPVVMLANFGTLNGPTDGTSEMARKIDSTVGPGKPGIAFVTGTGDEGGMPNHAGGNVAQGGTASIQLQKTTAGTLRIDLWYPGADRFNVRIVTPTAGSFGPYISPAGNSNADTVSNAQFNYYHRGSAVPFYGAMNGKREIMIDIAGPAGTYNIELIGATVTAGGRFDGTINPSRLGFNNRLLNFVVPGSIIDQATAHYNIAPNSYVIRTSWTDIDGIPRTVNGEGNVGELWLGSSVGPTFDGRLGVDLSAPGDRVVTTYNPTSYWATFRHNMIQGGAGNYGLASAVSAAAPQVTGLVALMLEKNPRLDAAQIKTMLQQSARSDSFTGTTPNPNWGYGKMDSYKAVELAVRSAARTPFDYDGDGKTDFSVFRPSSGAWYLQRSTAGFQGLQFGADGDKLTPADYDGDGKTDIAVYRPSSGQWYVLNSATGTVSYPVFGSSEDLPAPGDFDGDGKADLVVFRPSQGIWYRVNSTNGSFFAFPFGQSGDVPTVGDFDGDGKNDYGIFRPSVGDWYNVRSSNGSLFGERFGQAGDRIAPADYDGDGKTDLGIFRPSTGLWVVRKSATSTYSYSVFGAPADIPISGDYDGDGKADIGVWRPSDGTWYIQRSSNGSFLVFPWGQNGDTPTPSAFGN